MNATLEERLRRHYADRTRALPRHGPGLEAGSVVPRYVMPGLPGVRRRPRLALIAGAVAAVTLLCLVVINRRGVARFVVPNGDSITSVGDAAAVASEQIAVTGQTLPPGTGLVGSPITVPAGSKLNYWRWFPDLDISERAAAQGGTELCWRTPVGTGCIDDSFMSPDVGVIPTDGGVILLARPALVPIEPSPTDPLEPKFKAGPDPTSITAHLSDGSTVTASVKLGKDFGVWYARIDLAPGVTVVDATSS